MNSTTSGNITFDTVVLWPYTPSAPASLASMVVFGLLTLAHLVLIFTFRAWGFIPLVIGGVGESFGYYFWFRASSSIRGAGNFLFQLLLLLISPVLISASVYVSLEHMRRSVLGREAHVRNCCKKASTPFVLVDIVSMATQFYGAISQTSTDDPSAPRRGMIVLIIGLAMQQSMLLIFGFLVLRLRANPETTDNHRPYLDNLVAVACCIWVRNLVRALEFLQVGGGFISQHQEFVFATDALPIALAMLLLALRFPGRLEAAERKRHKIISGSLEELELRAQTDY
ncbi:hypothetical protein HK405_008569 [Cladochytrium tenue]|nr:hypothetical protein HK405_008569 [Cladochytrium tenue]